LPSGFDALSKIDTNRRKNTHGKIGFRGKTNSFLILQKESPMQPEPHWQEQIIARFMHTSRLYLGLMHTPASIQPPRHIAGSNRKLLRSLLIASSLGALFGNSAYATAEASRQSEPAKRSPNTQSKRTDADNYTTYSHRLSIHGRYR
jgi:hypothetical protein